MIEAVNELSGRRAPAPAPLDLVQSFINTVDLELGPEKLATDRALRGWLLEHKLITTADPVSEADRERAIRLREALRRVVVGNNRAKRDQRALRELNQVGQQADLTITFGPGEGAHLDPSAKGVDAALARILAAVYVSMLTGDWSRLKGCANDACRWAFYDASKNRSARWCTMADCGNDSKGRTYRARRRSVDASQTVGSAPA